MKALGEIGSLVAFSGSSDQIHRLTSLTCFLTCFLGYVEGEGEEGMGEGVEVGRLSGPTRPENIPASTERRLLTCFVSAGATSV